jgi:hypothetical protein
MKLRNEKGALLHAPLPKSATPRYQHCNAWQACFPRWQREAARLLNEYFRSGDPKHLVALVVHIISMRARAGGHTQ